MFIAIPSKGRSTAQVTARNLAKLKCQYPIVVCVPEKELNRYRRELDLREDTKKIAVSAVPDTHDGIARTREWILTLLSEQMSDDRVLMLDDDMDYCYRPDWREPKLLMVETPDKLHEMLSQLEGWLADGFVHVGLSARQGNNRPYILKGEYALHRYRDATRMMNAYAYDTAALRASGVELGRMQVMEDFDLTLQLLRKGLPNRVLFEFCWNQRGSGKVGGCSTYRTGEMQAAAAHKLAEYHPDFVKVVTKTSKETSDAWKGMKERVDVNVKWREAFASSGKEWEL